MSQEDLTRIKYIGPTRVGVLKEAGITSIKQLHTMSSSELARVKSIGDLNAERIKEAVARYYREKQRQKPLKEASVEVAGIEKIDRDLKKRVKRLHKHLGRVNEKLKPLWEKKYLGLYIDFKKKYKKLKVRLGALGQTNETLSHEVKQIIVTKADALVAVLKNVKKKPKKKTYRRTTREIQSFSRYLKDVISA